MEEGTQQTAGTQTAGTQTAGTQTAGTQAPAAGTSGNDGNGEGAWETIARAYIAKDISVAKSFGRQIGGDDADANAAKLREAAVNAFLAEKGTTLSEAVSSKAENEALKEEVRKYQFTETARAACTDANLTEKGAALFLKSADKNSFFKADGTADAEKVKAAAASFAKDYAELTRRKAFGTDMSKTGDGHGGSADISKMTPEEKMRAYFASRE